MTNFNKCTCVKVNKEKMDLIKAKGLNLQDLLDKAMDQELGLNNTTNVQQIITDLKLQIEILKQEKNNSLNDYQKKLMFYLKIFKNQKIKKKNIIINK